jgi:hypothetical protein
VNFGVATGSSQDKSGGGQWVVVPYGVLARRGSCRERCLIDRQMPCDRVDLVEGSRGITTAAEYWSEGGSS